MNARSFLRGQFFVSNIHWRWVTNQKGRIRKQCKITRTKWEIPKKLLILRPMFYCYSESAQNSRQFGIQHDLFWAKKIFLLIWEEPFSEIDKIKGLPTTSERVAKLRWIDWSKVSRNQHKKLVLTIWLRNLDSFSLTNRIVWIKFIRDIFPEWNWSFLKKPLLFICAVTEDWWLPLGVEFY